MMDNPFEQKENVAEIANLITTRKELRNILRGITQAMEATMNRRHSDVNSDQMVEMRQSYSQYQKMLWALNSQLDGMWSVRFNCDAWFER